MIRLIKFILYKYTMKIGIIGMGRVAKTLGNGWIKKNHNVSFGVRDIKKHQAENHENHNIVSIEDIIKNNDIIILSIPGGETKTFVKEYFGKTSNKRIFDCTNNIGITTSMTDLIKLAPENHFVKIFNTIGTNIMANPKLKDQSADAFICGDDKETVEIAENLASDLGFNPYYVGDSNFSQDLENLALLWIKMARTTGNREFAFKIITR